MSWNIAKPGDQINGPANITGNLTVDTNTLFVDSVNNRVGVLTTSPTVPLDVVGNARVSGTLSVQGRDIKSSIRAAAGNYAGVAFDGATSTSDIRNTSIPESLGSSDISFWCRLKVPTSNPSVNYGIQFLSDSTGYASSSTPTINISITSLGNLEFKITKDSTNYWSRHIRVSSFVSQYGGQVVDIVCVRNFSGNSGVVYINGSQAGSELTFGTTPPNWNDTLGTTTFVTGRLENSSVFSGSIYRSVLFNRALSAADVVDLIETGVNPADQWGTQTAAYSSDFSAGANNWAGVRSSVTGNVDGVLGVNDTLRTVVDGTASNSHYVLNSAVPGMVVTKRYKVAFDYYIPSANSLLNGVRLDQLTQSSPITANQTTTGAWATTSPVEFIALGTRLDLLGTASGNINFNGNSTDEFYIKNMVLTRIGAIVDLDFTVGAGFQATDRSTNNLHGTLTGGVSFTVPKKIAVLFAVTNTNGNQQMLGATAIPTNAVIEDIIVNSTGTATVSIGNASAGTQIVNAASVVSGRQKLAIATPFSTTGNLWVNSNSTANLQFTILYTMAQ